MGVVKRKRRRRSKYNDSQLMASQLPKLSAAMIPCVTSINRHTKSAAVLYHYPCPDGAFAALAAHLFFSAASSPVLFFPNTVYSPITPDDLPLHQIGDLYLLDFVGPSGFLRQISPKVDRVIVLDHHKTALDMLAAHQFQEKNVVTVIDMARSGATIAYDYFKEKSPGDAAASEFGRLREIFDYIEDADLWKWRLPNSKAFYNGLKDLKIEFDWRINPSVFDQLRSLDLRSVIEQGIASSSEKQRLIDEALAESFEIAIGGASEKCLAVRADAIPELRSDLGHQLACKSSEMGLMRFGAVVYKVAEMEEDGRVKISLRSDGEVDTAVISERFGGGGHRNASSFMVSLEEFERWKTVS